jgi:hypothetical protein
MQNMADRDMLEAGEGNAIIGKGATIVRFLRNTQNMLQGASMDDPHSVRPHFTRAARQNLQDIGGYLTTLRCTDDQIEIDQAAEVADAIRGNSDAEDMEEVGAVLSELGRRFFQWRTLAFIGAAALAIGLAIPKIQNWLMARRRRAKRHNTSYAAQYRWDDRTIHGVLLDINCYGTKLRHDADNPLPPGSSVEVAIENKWSRGTVMWSNVHYSGVQFKSAIDLATVDAVCGADNSPPKKQNGARKDAVS